MDRLPHRRNQLHWQLKAARTQSRGPSMWSSPFEVELGPGHPVEVWVPRPHGATYSSTAGPESGASGSGKASGASPAPGGVFVLTVTATPAVEGGPGAASITVQHRLVLVHKVFLVAQFIINDSCNVLRKHQEFSSVDESAAC